MVKKVTYTQLKAKKNWLLYTSSNRKKIKSKSRIASCKSRVCSTRRPIEPWHKRSFLNVLFGIRFFSPNESEPLEDQQVFESNRDYEWRVFWLECLSLSNIPGVNMASDAVMNGAHCIRHCVEKTCKSIDILRDSFSEGLKKSFKGIELCKEVCM
jgi:hypothetical protein